LFWDGDFAAGTHHGGIVAPEEFNPFAWMVADLTPSETDSVPNDPDRIERVLGVAPTGLKFQLNGGIETDYGARMTPGDVITSTTALAGYREREGRLGLMLFTMTDDVWSNQSGVIVKRTRSTFIRY
jgi:hypothetical protein